MDKHRRIFLGALAVPALGLSACAGPALLTYQNEQPKLVLRDYFNGQLKAWGMFTDRFGKVVKRLAWTWLANGRATKVSLMSTLSTPMARFKGAFGT